ncbi:MAG TPA: hypothetical protein PKH79_07635 [Prolixibacteraceae bacterium]|nr:hypothetical protein [Prolixibacteraceae bacterium]
MKYYYDSENVTFKTHNEYIRITRTFRFNITYNFGKMNLQVKKANRGINNNDKKSSRNGQKVESDQ